MAIEAFCNCCGCSQFDILRPGFYEAQVLNTSGPLVDFPTSIPTTVTAVEPTWGIYQFAVGSTFYAGRGTSKFDLSASTISLPLSFFPLANRGLGSSTSYPHDDPPSGSELTSTATVSLYDSVEANALMQLTERTVAPVYGIGPQKVNINDTDSIFAFHRLDVPLSEFSATAMSNAGDLRSYSEDAALNWHCTATYSFGVPPAQRVPKGFDLKQEVSLAGTSIVSVGPLVQRVGLQCLAEKATDALPTQGLFTAFAHRQNAPNPGASVTNRTVTIYRNGEQVFSGHNPTSQQLEDAYEEDGSYLTVTEVDERSLSEWTQSHPDTRRHGARMLKDYSSQVTDSVKPVVGFTPPNDSYAERTSLFPYGLLLSTEPLITIPTWREMLDEDPTSVICRPIGGGFFRAANGQGYSGAGTYTLRLFGPTEHFDIGRNYPTRAPTVEWTAHPTPPGVWNLFDDPKVNHVGATPQLEDPGLQTREYWRPRLDSEPVSSLLLTFDLPVNPEHVSANQLTLTKDGDVVSGCQMQRVGDQQWKILIPTEDQTPRSFWMLCYNPGGVVFRNDPIPEERYAKRSDFPATGEPRKIYIHPDTDGADVRFYWGRAAGGAGAISYLQIGQGQPPRDIYGIAFEPEPSVLAARVGWLMADTDGYPRQIDTNGVAGPYQIGRVASVSESKSLDTEKDQSKVGTAGGLYLPFGSNLFIPSGINPFGQFSPLTNYEGYTPSVPSLTNPPDDCSYFGLTTTIDPCPPAKVSACAAPRVAQKHASAIRCDEDIDKLEISLVAFYPDGSPYDYDAEKPRPADFTTPLLCWTKYVSTEYVYSVPGGVDFVIDWQNANFPQAPQVAAFIAAKSGQSYTFEKTLDGETLAQNVWACVDGAREASLEIEERRTRTPDGTCPTWTEPLYSVALNHTGEYSAEDVADWEIKPGYQHGPIRRGGQVVQSPEKYEPGDRVHAPGSSVDGSCFPWWIDRRIPASREEDFELRHGALSGTVRSMSGKMTQEAVQATASAYRNHKTFPALQTTTLGELCLSIAIRMTIKVEVDYKDVQLAGKYYTYGGFSSPVSNKCDNLSLRNVMDSLDVLADDGTSVENGVWCNPTVFKSPEPITEWASFDEGEEADSKTITHNVIGQFTDTLVFSKEQEEALANGEEVLFHKSLSSFFGVPGAQDTGLLYWKIKKG